MDINEVHYLTYEDIDGYDHYEVLLEIRNCLMEMENSPGAVVMVQWGKGEEFDRYDREKVDREMKLTYGV